MALLSFCIFALVDGRTWEGDGAIVNLSRSALSREANFARWDYNFCSVLFVGFFLWKFTFLSILGCLPTPLLLVLMTRYWRENVC